jgi:hypothetical protein
MDVVNVRCGYLAATLFGASGFVSAAAGLARRLRLGCCRYRADTGMTGWPVRYPARVDEEKAEIIVRVAKSVRDIAG